MPKGRHLSSCCLNTHRRRSARGAQLERGGMIGNFIERNDRGRQRRKLPFERFLQKSLEEPSFQFYPLGAVPSLGFVGI